MKRAELLPYIEAQMIPARWEHTLRVTDTAIKLADIHGENKENAETAALFHDFAKCWKSSTLKQYILENQLPTALLEYNKELWHGPVAAHFIQHSFGITEPDIVNAIRYHTTGRVHMSKLELIIFVADYIEPGRQFSGIEEVRIVAKEDLLHASWLVIRNTILFLCGKGRTIYPDTFYTYNDLTNKMGEM